MIISEKQIAKLIAYATQLFHTTFYSQEYRDNIAALLDEIALQQSEELREVK